GVIELAERHKASLGGGDLKLGQTKLKSVFAEFLVNAGIKYLSIAPYSHLSDNDGHHISAEPQFKISKSSVVDDLVGANHLLSKRPEVGTVKGTKAAESKHSISIVYYPVVGDSKCAVDEYYSEVFCSGRSTINIFTSTRTLLAMPLVLELAILTELLARVQYRGVSAGRVVRCAGGEEGGMVEQEVHAQSRQDEVRLLQHSLIAHC
ncbi:Myo-inositol-1-phosphate synthase-domain-containing protein, partial [Fomitopsis serialis]|uniref:Myo-inositol-1-phosphate synthase-domain-containing protein n=1 Tax=Fomitopsis serialis TaxID=139415 RepID=UPI00200757BF